MEVKMNEQPRNEKGQFKKADTVFEVTPTHRMKERRNEWRSEMEEPTIPSTAPHEVLRQSVVEDSLTRIRSELSTIQEVISTPSIPTEIKLPELEGGAEMGILGDKLRKKTQKEVKEKSPKSYTEMLVVFNDVQLLKEADQEALGAFLKYIDANKTRITHLVANGDILDFSAQSSFDKDLNTLNSTNDEIEAGRWLIDHLSKTLPNAKKVFIWGNHEQRWSNLIEAEKGNEAWVKTIDEQFGLSENGWEQYGYGSGEIYEWHDRIFWHGHRSGSASNIPKLELQDAGVSVTTGHVNRNMFHEQTDARGKRKSGITHGGFSKDNLGFMKKANTGWSQGFGVYFYDKKTDTETDYLVAFQHRKPIFIGPDGEVYDGTGWSIPGFQEVKRGRGRPRKK